MNKLLEKSSKKYTNPKSGVCEVLSHLQIYKLISNETILKPE